MCVVATALCVGDMGNRSVMKCLSPCIDVSFRCSLADIYQSQSQTTCHDLPNAYCIRRWIATISLSFVPKYMLLVTRRYAAVHTRWPFSLPHCLSSGRPPPAPMASKTKAQRNVTCMFSAPLIFAGRSLLGLSPVGWWDVIAGDEIERRG